jgi:hypothetical protein
LAQAYAAANDRSAMNNTISALEKESRKHYVSPYNLARAYASLGDKEQTFAWLEKAYDEHSPDFIELKAEPVFNSVRSDVRFGRLLSRVGFK